MSAHHLPVLNRTRKSGTSGLQVAMAATAIIGSLLTATVTSTGAQAVATPPAKLAATLAWSDEFNGVAGTSPDPKKWTFETGNSPWGDGVEERGWGNNELQYYTSSTRNAALNGSGSLVIKALRERQAKSHCWYGACRYTSTRINTVGTFSKKYGRIEARIKMPAGGGLLPAFWMLSDTNEWPGGGEIDIAEFVAQEPRTAWGTVHGPGFVGREDLSFGYSTKDGSAISDTFHVYAIDWKPNRIGWSVDGKEYGFVTPEKVKPGKWVFNDNKFHILLNLAVGGTWPGTPAARVPFPQDMVIDYVRAYTC